jgi:hypothetical protein
LIIVDICF